MTGQRTAVRSVLVVGAGLAGLSLAISLGRAGVAVEVIDVTDQVDRVGIGLIGRVMFALEELGVLDACRASGNALPGSSSIFTYMFDAKGTPLIVPPVVATQDARWFSREEMRREAEAGTLVLPGGISISRSLVEAWYGDSLPGQW